MKKELWRIPSYQRVKQIEEKATADKGWERLLLRAFINGLSSPVGMLVGMCVATTAAPYQLQPPTTDFSQSRNYKRTAKATDAKDYSGADTTHVS